MSKTSKKNHNKIPKMTEEQYEKYVMSLKEEMPTPGYKELVEGLTESKEKTGTGIVEKK